MGLHPALSRQSQHTQERSLGTISGMKNISSAALGQTSGPFAQSWPWPSHLSHHDRGFDPRGPPSCPWCNPVSGQFH